MVNLQLKKLKIKLFQCLLSILELFIRFSAIWGYITEYGQKITNPIIVLITFFIMIIPNLF